MLAGEAFGQLFESFEQSAFRLETLAVYDVEEEAEEVARFLAGEPMGPEWDDNPWVRAMTTRGKQVPRVHVLTSPLTDYLRYELAAYPGNITAGETIGIIDRAEQDVSDLPDHDFWLFDDQDVYRMHYTPVGAFIGAELLPAHRLTEYQGYRDHALAEAVPFADYWEQHH
ncbi:hypothetical protein GCM10015535_31270 [Streptomyces gelaticus]|uniref:DUF6879 domain-containing protein n=1 Tax=Streptomyces gelaticus TaxID=285446 RepID=A0ABQ2VYI0_9ACTN|nr:DUF6879 family protein [Streptomyces gelaticus]GGV85063.1 hypothetical protein GCM10015535_31270 [Streptomyces gelaticus]